jgi:hypothetical protein
MTKCESVACKQFKQYFYRVIIQVSTNDCRVKPALEKNINCAAFLKLIPNFNLLLTVTSDVLFEFFNPVFVPYIRFITVNKHQKSVFIKAEQNL